MFPNVPQQLHCRDDVMILCKVKQLFSLKHPLFCSFANISSIGWSMPLLAWNARLIKKCWMITSFVCKKTWLGDTICNVIICVTLGSIKVVMMTTWENIVPKFPHHWDFDRIYWQQRRKQLNRLLSLLTLKLRRKHRSSPTATLRLAR